MAEKIPGWLERVLLPQISELKGDIKVVNARIDGLGSKISNLDEKFSGKMDALDEKLSGRVDALDEKLSAKIDGVEKRLEFKIDAIDKRMDVTQRLAVVETQLKQLRVKA